eukprot:1054210-Amphidinium_carterae.3
MMLLIRRPSVSFRCCTPEKGISTPLISTSDVQPPPPPQQVHINAFSHAQRTECTLALNSPAVAGQFILQCTCLTFRSYTLLALCLQELAEGMRLTPHLLMSCTLRSFCSHLAEPVRSTQPVHFCTRSLLRSVGIKCLTDSCHYSKCFWKANYLQTAEAVRGGSPMPAAGETFHPRLAVCSAGLTNFHRIHGERQRGRNPLEDFYRDERQKHRRLHESHPLYTFATEDVMRRVKNFRESFSKNRVYHVDVRDLFNLAQDRNLCGHVGLHLKNVRTIGQHPKLDELLTAYGRIVWDLLSYYRESAEADGTRSLTETKPAEADMAKLKQPLLLIFWCKSGRHRSVAMADFAAWHLSQMLKLPTDLINLCNSAWPRGCDDCAPTCSRHGKVLEQRQEIYRTVWLPRLLKIHRPFGEGIETPRRARLQQDFPFAQRRCGGVHVAFEDDVEEVQRPLHDDARPDPGRTRIGMSTDAKYHREQDNARSRAQQWREDDQRTDRWGGWHDTQSHWQWDEHRWQEDRHVWNRPTPTGRSRSPPARTQHRSRSRVPPSPHPTDCEDDPTEDDDEYVQEVQQQQCERDDAFFRGAGHTFLHNEYLMDVGQSSSPVDVPPLRRRGLLQLQGMPLRRLPNGNKCHA